MVIRVTGSTQSLETSPQEPNLASSPFRVFEELFNDWAMRSALSRRRESRKPPVDIFEKDGKLFIRVEIPGVDEKDIDLKLDGKTLTIKGERGAETESSGHSYHQIEGFHGTFTRSFELPDSADTDSISAVYTVGVLAITIPQKPEVQPRTIKVNQG